MDRDRRAFFAAGGSSAARVLVWPSACLKDLAKPRGRAELLFALETEFVGWGLSMSSIVIRASGDSSATIALEPLGMGLGLEGQPRSVRDMLQARGFERLAQALDQVFGCACSALPYDFPGCGLLGLDEAAKSFSPKSIGRDPVELVAAMEALACASQMEADIQNGRPASGGARL